MSEYCTIQEVIRITHTTPEKMGINEEENPTEFEDTLTQWIRYASALIDDYTENPLTAEDIANETTKKVVYEDVASRIVANRCALSEAYKNYSVVQIDDWDNGKLPSDIFNNNLKDLLKKYKVDKEVETASNIGMYVVTGEDLWK